VNSPAVTHRALAFVLLTVLIDTIGIGIVIPVTPELIMELTGEGVAGAARYAGLLAFAYALMQFLCAPLLGNLSDRFGRRPVLLASLLALGVDFVLMGLAPSIAWLFAGRLVGGGFGATHATANAYVADVTPPQERAAAFGRIGAAWGLGFILGPVIGGLLGGLGPRAPFFFAAALALANVAFGFFSLSESLPRERRRPFDLARANPLGALAQMRRFPIVIALFPVLLCYFVAHDANPSTWTYYTMHKLGWTERDIGLSLGVVGLCVTIVQALLIAPTIARLGERNTVFVGFGLMSLGFLGFSVASSTAVMLACIVPFSLGCVGMPALRGLMTNQVPEDQQGELQGAIASLMSMTAIVSPVLMTQLFAIFSSHSAPIYFPGASFLTAALLMALALPLFGLAMRRPRG
jgi:DHA1 family tetracycline resistance protein-like MFS transporter